MCHPPRCSSRIHNTAPGWRLILLFAHFSPLIRRTLTKFFQIGLQRWVFLDTYPRRQPFQRKTHLNIRRAESLAGKPGILTQMTVKIAAMYKQLRIQILLCLPPLR